MFSDVSKRDGIIVVGGISVHLQIERVKIHPVIKLINVVFFMLGIVLRSSYKLFYFILMIP